MSQPESNILIKLEKAVTDRLFDELSEILFDEAKKLNIPDVIACSLWKRVEVGLDPQVMIDHIDEEEAEIKFQKERNGIDIDPNNVQTITLTMKKD